MNAARKWSFIVTLSLFFGILPLRSWGQTELIQDGGFESGDTFWTTVNAPFGIADNSPGFPRSGSWYAWLGGVFSSFDACYQLITIPSDAESATLSFYYNINSNDGGSVGHDFFLARIRDTNDIVLATLLQKDNRNRDAGHGPAFYHNATFDLMPYAGQPIKVIFESSNDASLISNFYVDDVSLQVVLFSGNHRPVANPQSLTVNYNASRPITLTATDADNDFLTYAIATPPSNGSLSGTPPNVTYQPNFNYSGPDSFTFTASDGQTNSAPATVSITVNPPLVGLIINPTWDSTITSDPDAATIMNTISNAILVYETKYSDPITVNITFAEMGGGLGQSSTFFNTVSYSSFYNALVADSKTTNDVLALAHIPSNGGIDPVDGTGFIRVTTANQRALGLSSSPPPVDGTISLNISLINIDRVNINPFKYDLMAVVSHEIDEVLGTSSSLTASGPQPNSRPADLFRYDSFGARNYTTSGDDAWFSIDGGATRLVQYNQDPSGDYGDWWSAFGGQTPRVQDAFGTAGVTLNLGVELTVLDVIGYDLYLPVSVSAPKIQSVTRTGNTLHFSWNSAAGKNYQVQYRTNLTQVNWLNLGSPIPAVGSTTSSSDTIGPDPRRYYRVALLPSSPNPPTAPQPNFVSTGPLSVETKYFLPAQAGQMKGKSVPKLPAKPFKGRQN